MNKVIKVPDRRKTLSEEECWQAVLKRGVDSGGDFFYAVLSTGIFCRPSCSSRRPLRENVRFFASGADAVKAGFRPCKRCRPMAEGLDAERAAQIEKACRLIDEADEAPSLAELAECAGLSPFYFHRLFKKATGLTPRAYIAALKAQTMRENLPQAASVTGAIYDAGYSSSSRFYENSGDILGMPVKNYRNGGQDIAISYAVEPCWLGYALIAFTDRGLCALLFGDDPAALKADLQRRFSAAQLRAADKTFAERIAKTLAAIEEPHRASALPLDISGTAFQQRVWNALRDIPHGQTASYRDIAEHIGDLKAVRAVAGACAANPVAIAIPCHRVIRSDGGISGYRWGPERKRRLLEREKDAAKSPKKAKR